MHKKKHFLTPLDELWSPIFPPSSPLFRDDFLPAVNVKADKNEFIVKVEIPGFNSDDVAVEIDGDYLVIKGEHKEELEEKKKDFVHQEFSHNSFHRRIGMPDHAELKKAKAKIKNGVMTVRIPKCKDECSTEKCIPIEIEK